MPFCGMCGNQLPDTANACARCGAPTARGLAQPGTAPAVREYRSAPALRPLGVGEIIDVALKVYRNNAATLFTIAAIVIVPVQVIAAFILASAPTTIATRVATSSNFQTTPSIDTSQIWSFVAASLVVAALSLVATQVATAASFRVVSEAYLGESPDWRSSLDFAFRRIGALVGLALLTGFLTGLGFVACLIPGIYLVVAWSVSVPALLHEEIGVGAALGRSRDLVRGRWWSVAGVLFLSQLVAGVIRFVLSLGLGVLLSVSSHGTIAVFVRSVVVGSISGVLITPFLAAAIAIMYFDLRVRKEGFDLELLAQRVGRPELAPATPPAAPPPAVRTPPRRPPTRPAPKRPGFDDEPDDDVATPPARKAAPRKPVARRPTPVEEEPDEAPPPRKAAPRKAAPRKPAPPATDAPPKPAPPKAQPRRRPPDDPPDDDPEFTHS